MKLFASTILKKLGLAASCMLLVSGTLVGVSAQPARLDLVSSNTFTPIKNAYLVTSNNFNTLSNSFNTFSNSFTVTSNSFTTLSNSFNTTSNSFGALSNLFYPYITTNAFNARLNLGFVTPGNANLIVTNLVSQSIQIGGGTTLLSIRSASAALDFPSIASGASADLTITVTGAAIGDSVSLGLPASPMTGITFNGFVSSADTVSVRAHNYTAGALDPASATYRATVIKF